MLAPTRLSRTADEELRVLVQDDLKNPTEVPDILKLADRWWERAETSSALSQEGMRRRAAHWYQGFESVKGQITKQNIEKFDDSLLASIESADSRDCFEAADELCKTGQALGRRFNDHRMTDAFIERGNTAKPIKTN